MDRLKVEIWGQAKVPGFILVPLYFGACAMVVRDLSIVLAWIIFGFALILIGQYVWGKIWEKHGLASTLKRLETSNPSLYAKCLRAIDKWQ